MKAIATALCYILALALVYGGFQLAPDMVWPETDVEIFATIMLVAGMSFKLAGHWLLLSFAK